MNKKIISLLIILFLSGCSGNNQVSTSIANETPTSTSTPTEVVDEEEEVVPPYEYPDGWSYKAANEEAIIVTKDTVEVSSIEVRGIPKTGIKVACFDEYEIYLDVLYNDASTESIRLLEKHIPIKYRHYLGEVGHHSISLAVMQVSLTLVLILSRTLISMVINVHSSTIEINKSFLKKRWLVIMKMSNSAV